MIKYISKAKIIEINKKTTSRHGGSFVNPSNILKESNLDYLLGAVDAEMFNEPLYPEIYHKAALYFYNIINGHIFNDGNKRTALIAALYFLNLNKYKLKNTIDNLEIQPTETSNFDLEKNTKVFEFTTYIASGLGDLELCTKWFKENIIPID